MELKPQILLHSSRFRTNARTKLSLSFSLQSPDFGLFCPCFLSFSSLLGFPAGVTSLSVSGSNYAGCRYRQLPIISALCMRVSLWPPTSVRTKTSCQSHHPYQGKQIVCSFTLHLRRHVFPPFLNPIVSILCGQWYADTWMCHYVKHETQTRWSLMHCSLQHMRVPVTGT